MYSVPCPLCGAAVGMQCELYSGGRRNSPHVDRKLYTLEAIEGRESEAIKDQSGQLVASLAYKRGDMSRSAYNGQAYDGYNLVASFWTGNSRTNCLVSPSQVRSPLVGSRRQLTSFPYHPASNRLDQTALSPEI